MQLLRSAVFVIFLFLWTAVLGSIMPWLIWKKEPAATRRLARMWAKGVIGALRLIIGLTHREIGLDNRPAAPALYVVNHQSAWETLVFNLLVPEVAIVLKEELYGIPVFGWYLRNSDMIALDRAGGAASMKKLLREGRAAAAAGRDLLIFPEGTRRAVDDTSEFHRGVLLLYKSLRLPVVPVALNAGVFWKPRSFFITPGEVTVSYLPVIPAGLPDEEFMRRVEHVIFTERDRLVALARKPS